MNFGKALFGLCALVTPAAGLINNHKDLYGANGQAKVIGNMMWHFGSGGLIFFSPDGSKIAKELGADKVCHNTTGYGDSGWRVRCDFYDVVSDGEKYVFASTARGVTKINVFEIDTGNIVGALPTCESPNDLDYHSLRDEEWIRCRDQNKDGSYLNVVSASRLSSDIATNITFTDDDVFSRGYVSTDPSLGDVGYLTDRNSPFLHKSDLSERKVMDDGWQNSNSRW
mmetsp:Transcript_46884/g.54796  ORF Transcript_46884/g.54796 Transcript_46884/m.54796 type:complete len:226 (-) Transcript_46884:207-884(-)